MLRREDHRPWSFLNKLSTDQRGHLASNHNIKSDPQKSMRLWFGFNLRRSTEDQRRLEIITKIICGGWDHCGINGGPETCGSSGSSGSCGSPWDSYGSFGFLRFLDCIDCLSWRFRRRRTSVSDPFSEKQTCRSTTAWEEVIESAEGKSCEWTVDSTGLLGELDEGPGPQEMSLSPG